MVAVGQYAFPSVFLVAVAQAFTHVCYLLRICSSQTLFISLNSCLSPELWLPQEAEATFPQASTHR